MLKRKKSDFLPPKVRIWQPKVGPFCARYKLLQGRDVGNRSYKVSPILCQTDLRIIIHRGHKFPLSLTLLSFKTRIEWPSALTATASFPSAFFQFLQYSRQHPNVSAHRVALMTKTALFFQHFLKNSYKFLSFEGILFSPLKKRWVDKVSWICTTWLKLIFTKSVGRNAWAITFLICVIQKRPYL